MSDGEDENAAVSALRRVAKGEERGREQGWRMSAVASHTCSP